DRVLRSGLRSISTSLIRELVDNELFEGGHTFSLQRQSPIAVPKYDLERLLFRGGDPSQGQHPGNPQHLSQRVGEMILRQYVLEEVYTPEIREAFRNGRLHLHQLDSSLEFLRVSVCADALSGKAHARSSRNGSEGTPRFFHRLFSTIGELLGLVSEEIDVFRLGEGLLAERNAAGESGDPDECTAWGRQLVETVTEYRAIRAVLPGPTATVTLRFPFTPRLVARSERVGPLFPSTPTLREDASLFLVWTLLRALQEPTGPAALSACQLRFEISPQTFRDRRYLETLRAVLERLPQEAPLSFEVVNSDPQPRPPSPPLGGKVTLNLPRVTLEAQRQGCEDPTPFLESTLTLARKALQLRAGFLRRLALHPAAPLSSMAGLLGSDLALTQYALGVQGLDDAVRFWSGESLHESEDARQKGQQLIAAMARSLKEKRRDQEPPMILEETPNRGPLRRFEELDQELFSDLHPGEKARPGSVYASGVRFSRWAPMDPLQIWTLLESYRPQVRLLARLDDISRLRADGVEVLLAFLEEVCRVRALQQGEYESQPVAIRSLEGRLPEENATPGPPGSEEERHAANLFPPQDRSSRA
ncbi:MAG: anaerobic ribonucleoside-triphosphate reductase, partial [Planctomycetota bacterium]